jgi:hypothetical protein
MAVTIYFSVENDGERAGLKESLPAIRQAVKDALEDEGFEVEAVLVSSRKSFGVPTTAAIFDVSEKTVRRLLDEGRLQGFKVRNCLWVSAASIEKYRQDAILKYQLTLDE